MLVPAVPNPVTLVLNFATTIRAQGRMLLDLVFELWLATGQLGRREDIILVEAILVKSVLATTLVDVLGSDAHFDCCL